MKILVCPDSFKGTLSASEAARCIRDGILSVRTEADVVTLPIGDGGEGTADSISSALQNMERITIPTIDPLGRPIHASYGIIDNSKAIIETAAASGLTLLRREERDVMKADTAGTGLLIADAYTRGIRSFIICMGGTATCDGGYGAYGVLKNMDLHDVSFTLLCDVDNPFCGSAGAVAVFAPQKGATPDMMPCLETNMKEKAEYYREISGIDISDSRFAGAAGGLAGMLMACYGAQPVTGINKVLELIKFDEYLKGVELVVTGEGKADATTLRGKAAKGILDATKRFDRKIDVVLVAGRVEQKELLAKTGFDHIIEATPRESDPYAFPSLHLKKSIINFFKTHYNHEN